MKIVEFKPKSLLPEDTAQQLRDLADAVERGEVTEFVAAYTLSGYYEFMRCSSINASLALIDILHMVTLDALRR